jgi:uncharacterized protein (TIGR02147 family)
MNVLIISANSLEEYLASLLEHRKLKNRRYSLRKLAVELKLEPSFLSKIINHKRKVTVSLVERLAKKLSLSPEEVQKFKLSVLQRMETSSKSETKRKRSNFQVVDLEMAKRLVGWHYFAILELFNIPNLNLTPRKISNLLDTPEDEIAVALDKLESLGLIVRASDRKLRPSDTHNTLKQSPFTVEELKETQRQFLVKSLLSLDHVPLNERDHSGMTLAIRQDQIVQAKKMIKSFRRRFMVEIEKQKPYERIYQLSISFFPLSSHVGK